jgi:hypothetical protein
MNKPIDEEKDAMSIAAKQHDIKSFGLEFGPNFFIIHEFSDHAGEMYIASHAVRIEDWTHERERVHHISMPLFAITHTPNWTLAPSAVFEENNAEEFLTFNTPAKPGSLVCNDRILYLEGALIYEADQVAESFLDAHYPGLGLRHGGGLYLEIIGRLQQNKPHTATYIHQLGDYYHISVYERGKLILSNAIDAPLLEDIRYFVLFTLKQLGIEPANPIYLSGEAAINESLKTALGKFYPDIQQLYYQKQDRSESAESIHFIGKNAHLCA